MADPRQHPTHPTHPTRLLRLTHPTNPTHAAHATHPLKTASPVHPFREPINLSTDVSAETCAFAIAAVVAAAAAIAMLPPTLAYAGSPPKIKEGLWEVHGQSIEKPANTTTDFTYKICRDHAFDKAATTLLKNVKGCTTILKDLGSGKYASASTCAVAGITIVSNGVTTYNKNHEAVHSETQAKYTPALNGKTDETMTQDQQYVGNCPTGVKPGDTIGTDGLIRHHD
jgi:hypothetical protein